MPTKQLLEFFLDILQRRDKYEIFAQPVNGQEVVDYYSIIKEPMDFGTMRAKLQEGMYTSFDQFERDVFLISSNAMKFNASDTVYYTEARAMSKLAQRLFHGLRAEPENFQVELTRTRRCPGRRAQSQNSNSRARVPKSNDNNASTSGSRDVWNLSSCEIDKRMTYMPQAQTICSENEKMVSAFLDASKSLQPMVQVNTAATQYTDSLLQFVEDLGTKVQMVAKGKFPTQAPKNPFSSPTFGFSPKPTAFQNPAFVNEGVSSHFPCDTVSKYSAAYKGKAACIDEGINSYRKDSDFHASRPNTTNWIGNHNLVGKEGDNSTENMDLLIATLSQISNIQKGAPSGCGGLMTGYEGLPKKNNPEAYFTWLLNPPEPAYTQNRAQPVKVTQLAGSKPLNREGPCILDMSYSPKTAMGRGEWLRSPAHLLRQTYIPRTPLPVGSRLPNWEGPSRAAPCTVNAQTVQPMGWKSLHRAEQIKPQSQVPVFNPIDLLAGAYQQPQPNAQQSSVDGNGLPDLDLQL